MLPFESLSDDMEDHNLASGLTYEVINDLMRFAHFRVYSIPASFRLDPQADPQALARDLGVSYVVKGALSSEADQVRLMAQLYDAASGRIVWSDNYDRNLNPEALLEVQEELAGSVATVLGETYGKVRGDLTERASARRGAEHAELHLRAQGLRLPSQLRREALPAGARLPDAAVARDPDYAAAWAMLGWLQLDAARFHYVPAERKEETLAQAIASASHAVDLDGGNPSDSRRSRQAFTMPAGTRNRWRCSAARLP